MLVQRINPSIIRASFSGKQNAKAVDNKFVDNNCLRAFNNNYSINNRYLLSFCGSPKPSKNTLNNFQGCLMGGAIGDSFGSRVEAWSYESIKETFGDKGLRSLLTQNGTASITDDTQMSLFSAYALIRAKLQNGGEIDEKTCVEELKNAYKDWYLTQVEPGHIKEENNLLLDDDRLYKKCFPGVTCLNSLESDDYGNFDSPINDSKGSGGVMRSAPIGLVLADTPHLAFRIGAKSAALTHGNPDGYLPAGALSFMIAHIIQGDNLADAVNSTIEKLESVDGGKNTADLLKKAVYLSKKDYDDFEAISKLGKGFVGDEALAIAAYCALKHEDNFKEAIIASINHDGDSDTVGAITGNILGAYLGEENISNKLKGKIELTDKIYEISKDLYSSIDSIEEPELKYGTKAKTATLEDRRKDDKFNFDARKITFSEEDKKILKELPLEDALKYRSFLIENKRFVEV